MGQVGERHGVVMARKGRGGEVQALRMPWEGTEAFPLMFRGSKLA